MPAPRETPIVSHLGAVDPDRFEPAATVHVIDDDPSMRRAISALLRSAGVASCTYESCAEFLRADRPDGLACLMLDVRLPGMSGLDFQAQLAAQGIDLPVVMITGHGDVPMSVQAMKAGAVDFLTKPFRDQDLLDAVNAAIDRHRTWRLTHARTSDLLSRYASLSTREKQVMELVTTGRLNKQAAFDLGLSEITVKLYRASAMKKMKARTLADFVRMAERLQVGAED
ncbi:response regulator transcription factor [Sphingomonas crocodyli]|uniref:Response regulator transcription factor n=2 Tax=Sphingomonas crocodyli TaxID=1979270 RepID=A0A437M0U1_9SPHN|nr:response regulator transcription factor [Sphingomonas crocodyli]